MERCKRRKEESGEEKSCCNRSGRMEEKGWRPSGWNGEDNRIFARWRWFMFGTGTQTSNDVREGDGGIYSLYGRATAPAPAAGSGYAALLVDSRVSIPSTD